MKFGLIYAFSVILAYVFDFVSSTHTHSHSKMFTKTKSNKNIRVNNVKGKKERPVDITLPEALIYWQGWVKYYHYSNDTHYDKPPSLFQNNAFYNQRIKQDKIKQEKDIYGTKYIPNKASFYMVLYNNSVTMYSQRGADIVDKVVDSFKIENIDPVPEDHQFEGGIRNDGTYSFGSCIEIKVNLPVSTTSTVVLPNIWIICAATDKEKYAVMKLMIKLKILEQRQHNNNIRLLKDDIKLMKDKKHFALGNLIANPLGDERTAQFVKKPTDGYWILLNDWTTCNKKCGGGLEFQQWMCVPPKQGGKPCVGKAIRTKPCNIQPCPSVNNLLILTNKNQNRLIAPKPVVKVGPFSSRPQRYEKCVVRENDAFIDDIEPISKEHIKRPVRVVMNNHTITIFKDDSYDDLAFTFELDKTKFTVLQHLCCFEIADQFKTLQTCSYDSECDKKTNEWVLSWQRDFKLFKSECFTGLQEDLITSEDEESIEDKMNNDLASAEIENANQQAMDVKRNELGKEKRKYREKKRKLEDDSFKVLGKEIELENMVQNEEKEKEEIEERLVLKKIALEKKKKECLEQSFEERALDDEFKETEKESIADSAEIKLNTVKKIEEGRWKLKKRILAMKLKSKAKKQALDTQLQMLRSKMAKEIILANKNGDINNCIKGKKDVDFRESYCNNAFVDDWVRNSECKSNEEFCYTCCENEFGSNFVEERDRCYDMCDKKPKEPEIIKLPQINGQAIFKKLNAKPEEGKWVWAPKEDVSIAKFN